MISLREDIFAFICQLERSRELNYIKKWVVIIIAFFVGFQSFAQQSSVTVTTQFFPPYSLKLSDYATSTDEKLAVQLLLNDITEVNRSVRLRMYIENKNVAIKTVDFPTGETPLFLDGGFPLRLSNLDIGYLFQLQNLQGINAATYNESLPEGLYQFCFEVYDALTNVRLSQKSCTPVYLVQNDPPILNLPTRGEIVAQKDVQNIIFQWTPRHLNATNVEYEFTLKELWDNYADPQAAFLASVPLYQTTSFAPTLLYGLGEPQLLPNKLYAWQVRSISRTGISENSVFKNNGYSEIFHFIYTADCNVPQYLLSEAQSLTKVKVMWQADADQTKFNIQYRKKDVKDAVWFERAVQNAQEGNLYNLQPDTWYEFRVGSNCITDFTGTDPLYSYSDIAEFKTPQKGENSTYNCGYVPSISIANTELIDNLGVNEVFTAGDFPVTIKEIELQDGGSFTGWGFIVVPYLADTRLKVSFNNIKINTDLQLIQGVVLTTYDPTWSGVNDIQNELDAIASALGDLASIIQQLLNLDLNRETRESIRTMLDAMTSEMSVQDLPGDIREPLIEAQNNIETASNNYYDAQERYNNATTDEEKEEAQKEMDEAKDDMKDALKDLNKANDKLEKFLKEMFNIIKKAMYEIVRDYNDSKETLESDYLKNTNSLVTLIPEATIKTEPEIDENGLGGKEQLQTLDELKISETDKELITNYFLAEYKLNKLLAAKFFSEALSTPEGIRSLSEELSKDNKTLAAYINEITSGSDFNNAKKEKLILEVKEILYNRIEKVLIESVYNENNN